MNICKICGQEFENKNILANHVRWHHKDKIEFSCECGRLFSDKGMFNYHKQCCTGKLKSKVWICQKCNLEIKTSREKHFNSCNGFGPRRRNSKTYRRGSIESKKKMSEASKKLWSNPDFKLKVSLSLRGKSTGIALTKEKELERKNKISATMKKNPEAGGKRHGSGRGKKGWYKDYFCDSSWELAFVVYNLEHDIIFERNLQGFEYEYEGEIHKYFPDFVIENVYYEIKGYSDKKANTKHNSFSGNLNVLDKNGIKKYLDYTVSRYGKDFVKLYEHGRVR